MKATLSDYAFKPSNEATDAYDSNESDDIFGQIKGLIDGTHPGVLTTVDPLGFPRARWMATLSLDKLPYIYTLTSERSRKVVEIERNPAVGWLFSSSDLSLVVTLRGTARICRDAATRLEIWRLIRDRSQAYFLKNCVEGAGYAVVETKVDSIECCTPQNAMRFRVDVDRLRRETNEQ